MKMKMKMNYLDNKHLLFDSSPGYPKLKYQAIALVFTF